MWEGDRTKPYEQAHQKVRVVDDRRVDQVDILDLLAERQVETCRQGGEQCERTRIN